MNIILVCYCQVSVIAGCVLTLLAKGQTSVTMQTNQFKMQIKEAKKMYSVLCYGIAY